MISPFSDKTYNFLKWVAQILLPALGALYFGISELFNIPGGVKVVGAIALLDTFLGLLLKKSTDAYVASGEKYDGTIQVEDNDTGGKMATMVVEGDPEDALKKDELTFKVDKGSEEIAAVPVKKPRKRPAKKLPPRESEE